ncbi:MAG: hypothetical protein R3Y52_04155, partial [Psittacicella sp.]
SAFESSGLSASPKDALKYISDISDIKLTIKGGKGCVREIIDYVLDSKGITPEDQVKKIIEVSSS